MNSTNASKIADDGQPCRVIPLDASLWTSLIFLFTLAVLAIFGNGLVCFAFATNKRLRILTNYYVVSLAVSDILVGSINIPLWMYIRSSDWCQRNRQLHQWYTVFDIFCGTASIWNMTAISIDRFAAVIYPTVYKHRMKNVRMAGWTILGVWTFSTFVSSLRFTYKLFNYAIFVVTLSFFVPLLIILFTYGNIYRVVRYRAKWTGSVLMEIRLARTLSIVIGAFFICWGPFFITNLVTYYCRQTCNFTEAIQWIKWMQYASACINPVIYTIRNREFRFTFHKLVFRCHYRNGKYTFNQPSTRNSRCGCCQLGGPLDDDGGETRARCPTYTEESMIERSHVRTPSSSSKHQTRSLGFDNVTSSLKHVDEE